ncbi:hypothetical protein DL89DRAFT_268726 [Linderina pennispora]|uniref:Uncharacterized protein n=1 Tax=Linderina pennispora TaxID=61395 RepID=A0A1Y1W4T8_9FUNG|nr:uncharacterized protein DL89DRAFT_268726 [Linderina pennispora]ORX68204.1 hypothetical protein DL89DRAFT_268726 [Linderina pennispora]
MKLSRLQIIALVVLIACASAAPVPSPQYITGARPANAQPADVKPADAKPQIARLTIQQWFQLFVWLQQNV